MAWGVTLEMVNGLYGGIFDPHASAIRGEVVTILGNFVDFMKESPTFPQKLSQNPPMKRHLSLRFLWSANLQAWKFLGFYSNLNR